jgi:hypothetical protein
VEEEEGEYESPPSAAEADGDYEEEEGDSASNEPSSKRSRSTQEITGLSRTMSRTSI